MGNPNSSDRDPGMQPPTFPLDDDTDVDAGVDDNEEMNDTDEEDAAAEQPHAPAHPQQRPSHPARQHDGGPDDDDHNGMHSDADEDDDPHPPLAPSPDLMPPPADGTAPDPSLSMGLDADDDIDQLADENAPIQGNQLHLQGPAAPPAASPASSSPSPAPAAIPRASLEPDDPSVPCWERKVPGFGPYAIDQINRGRVDKLSAECTPVFQLLGHYWQIDLYANRVQDRCVGLFLKYIGCKGQSTWERSPPVVFRIVVFHRDVVAETNALNAARKAQHDAAVAAQEAAAASATAESVPAPPGDFVPLSFPCNDPRNLEHARNVAYTFSPNEDFGFSEFVPHKEMLHFLCGTDQTLHFRVLIQFPPEAAGRPMRSLKSFIDEAKSDEEKVRWPYLGLDNQGATCYMNSYLQTLFYLPAFRRAVYSLPVEASQLLELLEPSSSSSTAVTTKDIPLALQHLFYTLDKSDKACNTKKLTQSFGWTAADSFQQHDVQEFSRVLLDHLESVTKDHPTLAPITRLFEGKQQMFIECTHVPYSSTRIEPFLDLSLNVKGMDNLQRSFADYVAEESMDGKNQYRAVDAARGIDFGMQDARKGVRFIRFPSLLQLQLKRFEMSYDGSMKKVNDRLEFPLVLDLTELEFGEMEGDDAKQPSPSPDPAAVAAAAAAAAAAASSPASGAASPKPTRVRLPTNPRDPAIYHLQSVLVHRGSLGGGHYFAFTRPFLASLQQRARELKQAHPVVSITDLDELSAEYEHSPFFKFDDETVSICKDSKAATEMNFGGPYMELVQQLGKRMTITSNASGNAYMLVYVRRAIVWNAGFAPMHEAVPASNGAAADGSANSSAAAMSDAPPASLHLQPTALPLDHSHSSDESKTDPELTQPAGDAAMADATLPSSAPSLQRASSMRFTETPQSLRDFVASLAPVAVPFPEHIERGIEEAKQVRRAREEEMLIKAQQFPLEVIFERDLLWQGLRDDETEAYRPEGGVAGLDLTVAPAITDRAAPLPLRQFLFKQPSQSLVLHKTDTLSKVRAQLAEQYGVLAERLQLWRVTRATPTTLGGFPSTVRRGYLEYLSDLNRQLSSLVPLGVDTAATPLLFVRDTLPIDQHPALDRLSAGAGNNPQNYARSVDPKQDAQAGHGARQMLLFKFFDHVTQRLVYLGSATLWKHMSVQELHTFARGLLRSKGVRRPTVEVPPTLVSSFAQMQAPPAAAIGAMNGDAMMDAAAPASSSSSAAPSPGQLAFVSRMLALPSAALTPGHAVAPDVEVLEVSVDERRWDAMRKRKTADELAALTTTQSLEAACLQSFPMDTPLHMIEEFDAMQPPATAPPSALIAAYNKVPAARPKEECTRKYLSEGFGKSLRECKLQNGSVIVISTRLPHEDLQWLQLKHAKDLATYQAAINPPLAPTAAPAPALTVPSRSPKKNSKRAAPGAVAMTDASTASSSSSSAAAPSVTLLPPPPSVACTSPLPLGTLSTLPVAPRFHTKSASYLEYLHDRFVVEWKPAVLDMTTMLTNVLDPAALPTHPLSQMASQSIVMEVRSTDTIEQLHTIVQAHVVALLPAGVVSSCPPLSDPSCYRLWRQSVVCASPLVKFGDLRSQRDRSHVAHALVATNTKFDTAFAVLESSPKLRCEVPTLYFEVSPKPALDLVENWWVRLEFVDGRGQVLTAPSSMPGLVDLDPFLVSKHPLFSVAQLKEAIYHRFVRPNQQLFTSHDPPMRFIGTDAEEKALKEAKALAEAQTKLKLKEEADAAAVDVKSEASGEVDIAAAVHLAAAAQQAQQQHSAGKRRFEDEDQPGLSASSPIKNEPDSKKQRGDASKDIASAAPSLALAAPAAAAAAPLLEVTWRSIRVFLYSPSGSLPTGGHLNPWARFHVEWATVSECLSTSPRALRALVERYLKPSLVALEERAKQADAVRVPLPLRYTEPALRVEDYTHPLPFKLSVYLPTPDSNTWVWVYRFTTFSSAEIGPAPKASYAFSPLPPILLTGTDASFDRSAAILRAQLATQLSVDPSSLRLAVLRPKDYELIPADEFASLDAAASVSLSAPAVSAAASDSASPPSSVFSVWRQSLLSNDHSVVLGLFDESTKHVLSTSGAHEVTQTAVVPWLKAKPRPAGLSINGTK